MSTESANVTSLENRFEAVLARLEHLEDQLEDRDERIDEQDRRIDSLENQLQEVDDRTDLLQKLGENSATSAEQKISIIVQRLVNEASRRGAKSNDEPARASVDAKGAVDTLQGTIDRTTVYGETGLFKQAERLVDDTDVLYYITESRSSSKNSRLVLNLEAGTPPASIAGHKIDCAGVPADD